MIHCTYIAKFIMVPPGDEKNKQTQYEDVSLSKYSSFPNISVFPVGWNTSIACHYHYVLLFFWKW